MNDVQDSSTRQHQGIRQTARRAVRGTLTAVAAAAFLVACGGGGGSDTASSGTDTPEVIATVKPTATEASRFLGQATMGATEAEIKRLQTMSYDQWLDEQFAKPQTLHRLYINQASADLAAVGQTLSITNFWDSWWSQALGSDDQLRQRAAFALSQIMVVSFTNDTLRNQTRGVASYYDMLGENAFGNFRKLLEDVTYHPMMGIYLSHMKNQKEDPTTGRVPDLNYAREICQLFAIGEQKLNLDGSVAMSSDGKAQPGYVGSDLTELSKVFTGLSWYAGPSLSDRTARRFAGNDANLERDWRPMQAYAGYTAGTDYHSLSQKSFLGTTIPASSTQQVDAEIKTALDTIFNHPNVGPFIAKQLIQRMVTSNPSAAYVTRVANKFANNGSGVRGDMKAVFKAILMDPEARKLDTASTTAGKLREPVLRLSGLLRAFDAKSVSGRYTGIGNTDDPATSLGQTPMYAPTVFNFFRPGYQPTNTTFMAQNLVAPEMQLTHDLTVAGYLNYIRTWLQINTTRDIQHTYDAEMDLATTPTELVEKVNLKLTGGTMSEALKTQIANAVASRAIPAAVYNTTSTTGGTLTRIAEEGDSFIVSGTGTVRYGSTTVFVEKTVTGAGECSNEYFGTDPIVGTAKTCWLFTPATSASASAASSAASAAAVPSNNSAILTAKRDRVYLAVFLTMASTDYLIQK